MKKEAEKLAAALEWLGREGREAAEALKAELQTWPDKGESWLGEAVSWLSDIESGEL